MLRSSKLENTVRIAYNNETHYLKFCLELLLETLLELLLEL